MLMPMMMSAQNQSDHHFEVGKHLDIFNQIYKNLELLYVDTLNPKETIGTAINSMLRSLDPYTEYYAQDETKDLKMMLTGKYAGIGALIRKHQKLDRVVIDEPYAGMPAAEAGLQKGDVILSIDDSLMTDKAVSYVSNHLRGEPGTSFLLKVFRPSTAKEMKFKITRKNIKLPELPYYGIREGNIGYINYNSFTQESSKDVRRAFVDLKKQGATSLIFDLRNNPGGLLSSILAVLDYMVPDGTPLANYEYYDGTVVSDVASSSSYYGTTVDHSLPSDLPIAVLCNQHTASAGELFTCAMQDYAREGILDAVIVGTVTYGKGTMQTQVRLGSGCATTISFALYNPPYSPNYEGKGITPDVPVELPEEAQNKSIWALTDEEDAQKTAAINSITERMVSE